MTDARAYRTRKGRVLTESDLDALADEAEGGYDVEKMKKGRGRPRLGSGPALVVPVRLHQELLEATKAFAAAEQTSVSELVRDALRGYLASEVPVFQVKAAGEQEVDEVRAAEAESGYELAELRPRPGTRAPRPAVVVPVRMPPEMKDAVERRAEAELTSVSEIVRAALRSRVSPDGGDDPPGGSRSRPSRYGPTEADTCRDFVLPRLKEAGWDETQIVE